LPGHVPDRSRAIGSILVEGGRLASGEIERILNYAAERRIRFGDAAIQLDLITPEDVLFALARQFKNQALVRGPEGVAEDLIAGYDPQNPMLECLRNLRSQIMLRWYPANTHRVFAVVSPERGEGRSWIVANLAVAFCQIGLRTLIIDADLRHPRQQQIFNLAGTVGLCELLTGRAGADVAQRIHPQLRLFLVTAGAGAPNPQELLSRPVFPAVIGRFAAQFDLILVDTPAANESSDAQIIASHSRSALLLARKDRTGRAKLRTTMQSLRSVGVGIIGSVMNEH
jgi:chain length determinant protein tyrosine kinase EpsG